MTVDERFGERSKPKTDPPCLACSATCELPKADPGQRSETAGRYDPNHLWLPLTARRAAGVLASAGQSAQASADDCVFSTRNSPENRTPWLGREVRGSGGGIAQPGVLYPRVMYPVWHRS